MTGTVIRAFPNKGYCFIRGEDGQTRFLHANEIKPVSDFDTIREGQGVEFDTAVLGPGSKGNGLRAVNARLIK